MSVKHLYSKEDNPQQRVWTAVLYPEDDNQQVAIDLAIGMNECILMLHDKDISKKGDPIKPHYHLVFMSDKPYYKKKLITKDLDLDWDNNWNYFYSLKEIDYSRADDYIIYLTHIDYPNKHYYDAELFIGGNRQYAINVCKGYKVADEVSILDILDYLEQESMSDHNFRFRSLKFMYEKLYKKFGSIVYRKWGFIKQFIYDYWDSNK